MNSDNSAYFPPEILDVVIDHLHDDTASLAACGLACRSLLPASRYHLFSDINFTPWNLASFLELITRSSIIDLPSIIRSVAIHDLLPSDINYHTGRRNMSRALDVMRHLRSVTSLSISGLNMMKHENTFHSHVLAMLSNLPDVLDLDLLLVYYQQGDYLFDVIHAFPKLQSLSMRRCVWTKPLSPTTVQRLFKQQPLYIRELDLLSTEILARQIMTQETPSMPISEVQCFKLSCGFCPDPSVQRVIDTIGWPIEELFVGLNNPLDVCKYSKIPPRFG